MIMLSNFEACPKCNIIFMKLVGEIIMGVEGGVLRVFIRVRAGDYSERFIITIRDYFSTFFRAHLRLFQVYDFLKRFESSFEFAKSVSNLFQTHLDLLKIQDSFRRVPDSFTPLRVGEGSFRLV